MVNSNGVNSNGISSIGRLLDAMGMSARYFDLGRHIQELDERLFREVEDLKRPYPAPYLHQAWLGLLFWDPQTPELPLLWFLRFPLDEQGLLVPSERDRFLQQLLTAIGGNLQVLQAAKDNSLSDNEKSGKQLAAVLEGNPFVFKPTPERQAAVHARVSKLLKLPPSQYYNAASDYLRGELSQWQHLGVQGLADVAVEWPNHQTELIKAMVDMPNRPLTSLCLCLENESVNGALGKALQGRLVHEIEKDEQPDIELVAALIRALSQCQALELRQRTLLRVLHSNAAEYIEVLAAIATRCPQDLCDTTLGLGLLEAISRHGQDSFNRVLSDLLFIPAIRPHILTLFRHPERSPELVAAIGGLLNPSQ